MDPKLNNKKIISQTNPKKKVSFNLETSLVIKIDGKKNLRRRSVNSTELSSSKFSNQLCYNINNQRPSIILTVNQLNNNNYIRHDAYGNLIDKESKKHKVTFIDNITNKNLAEIILIDSKKEDNKIDNNKQKKENVFCSGNCSLF